GHLMRQPPLQKVAPRLWLGRRPKPEHLPTSIDLVVDLTAEFSVTARQPGIAYITYPTLDATAPSKDAIQAILDRLTQEQACAYIHCASGHGRSATVVVAWMLHTGQFSTVDHAIASLQHERPGVRLNAAQRRRAAQFAPKTP
ncbi:MAG: dual specificity protein phosphatase family protein, partial [Myxococcota bacterium]